MQRKILEANKRNPRDLPPNEQLLYSRHYDSIESRMEVLTPPSYKRPAEDDIDFANELCHLWTVLICQMIQYMEKRDLPAGKENTCMNWVLKAKAITNLVERRRYHTTNDNLDVKIELRKMILSSIEHLNEIKKYVFVINLMKRGDICGKPELEMVDQLRRDAHENRQIVKRLKEDMQGIVEHEFQVHLMFKFDDDEAYARGCHFLRQHKVRSKRHLMCGDCADDLELTGRI